LLEVVFYRFDIFKTRFGREPRPDDPLFFDPESDSPVQAGPFQTHSQLADACRETGVELALLNKFWDLGEDTV
jgi:hypothetical protein